MVIQLPAHAHYGRNVMSYLPAVVLVVVGLSVLLLAGVRVSRGVRRFTRTADAVRHRIEDETGTLRARSAALRVAMKETRARVKHAPADVPSDGRGRQEDDRG
jgi:hypothetical protein